MDIHDNMNEMVELKRQGYEDEEEGKSDKEPVLLTSLAFADILLDSGLSEEQTEAIEKSYEETFGEDLPEADKLVEPKLIEANQRRKDRLELITQVENLKQQLEEKHTEDTIAVHIQPEKTERIYTTIMDGRKCLVIPIEEDEQAMVNGQLFEE